MKSLLFALILVPYFSQSLAAPIKMTRPLVVRCGLPDFTYDENFEEVGESLDIGFAKPHQILALPQLTKAQLIQAAFATEKKTIVYNNQILLEAIEYLKESSEGGDLYIAEYQFQGRLYTYIQYYPGGNEGGIIFAKGSHIPLAGVGDQDIYCWKK